MAPKVEKRPYYDVYQVAEDHVILPEGGRLSKMWDRTAGNRVVEVVDVNGDGVAGDGDTAILFNGKKIENIKFNGPPLVQKRFRKEFDWELALRKSAGKDVHYDVENIDPRSLTAFCVALASSMQSYGSDRVEEARDIAASVTDNPVAAGAIVAGAAAISFHPKGRVLMEAVGLAGAVGGTGYIVHDRVKGVVHGQSMGRHDLTAGLAIVGGASAMRGMTVEGVWQDTMNGLGRAMKFLEGSGGAGFSPGLVGAGVGGSSIIFSGEVAATAAIAAEASTSAVATGGRLSSNLAGISSAQMVATFANGSSGVKTREVHFNDELVPNEALWLRSRASTSADNIREALKLVKSDLEGAGLTEEANQVASVLDEVDQNLKVIAEIFQRTHEPAVQEAITTALMGAENQALRLLDNPTPQAAEFLLQGIRQRMVVIRDFAQRFRIASFKVPGNGNGAARLAVDVPANVRMAKPLDQLLPSNPGKKRLLFDALRKFFQACQNGGPSDAKALHGAARGVSEARFHNGSGPRIYYVERGGVIHLLGVGDKGTQASDLLQVKRMAETLGLAGFSILVWDWKNQGLADGAR